MAHQVKLLRVLQEGTFTPVGAENQRRSDVRVIAATHRDLADPDVFRPDLFYRLAVFEVTVPSLLERAEDIPTLVHRLVERICARMGREVPTIPVDVMQRLLAHDWPGNVRELENVLEGALVMSRGEVLEAPVLFAHRRANAPSGLQPLEQTIRVAIEAALRASGGKLYGPGGAAEMLALNPATLQSKMRKLGVDRLDFVR